MACDDSIPTQNEVKTPKVSHGVRTPTEKLGIFYSYVSVRAGVTRACVTLHLVRS